MNLFRNDWIISIHNGQIIAKPRSGSSCITSNSTWRLNETAPKARDPAEVRSDLHFIRQFHRPFLFSSTAFSLLTTIARPALWLFGRFEAPPEFTRVQSRWPWPV